MPPRWFALGFEAELVGRSHECDFPESIKSLPVCTAPKFDVAGSSLEIDQRVKGLLQNATSVYHVDADLLRRLRPDVIVTQRSARCAVSLRDVEAAVCQWVAGSVRVVSLQPNGLADVWTDLRTVAEALGIARRRTGAGVSAADGRYWGAGGALQRGRRWPVWSGLRL